MPRLRVGSRASPLALRQTELLLAPLLRARPSLDVEMVPIRTQGDRSPGGASGVRDFTDRLDRAVEEGEVDVAVHSAKDLPSRPRRRVEIVCTPVREDPRDALVLTRPGTLASLPRRARIGSSSPRRRAQLLSVRGDLDVREIHGNVGTRLTKLDQGEGGLSGLLLAVAGLRRLGLEDRISQRLPLSTFLPSPGQGVLVVHGRAGEERLRELFAPVHDLSAFRALSAERTLTAELGADCDTPLGAWARLGGRVLRLTGALYSPDGSRVLRGVHSGPATEPEQVGRALAERLLERGAREFLHPPRSPRP